MIGSCSGRPSKVPTETTREWRMLMYPGLEADCQAAMLRYRAMVAAGQHQQFLGSALPASGGVRAVSISLRQQCGALLVRAGERLQRVGAVTREGLGSATARERGAVA